GSYQAAIGRFRTLLENYPKQTFADEVLFLLGESYHREQNFKKSRTTFKKLLKYFPKSEYTEDARERLREKREG
ncbi:MAG: outer membrane protein assembly factor BamD, partial [Nitrospinae bacterium]|nr:outer membrane protein assembly factor BamD [Nitrospinota bacterium]